MAEIETARMRHAWAKAEVKRGDPSLALTKYLGESQEELHALKALMTKKRVAERP
jgi:hypothetical protein